MRKVPEGCQHAHIAHLLHRHLEQIAVEHDEIGGLALRPAIVAASLGTPANYSVALWVGVGGGLLSLGLLLIRLRTNKISRDPARCRRA